MYLSQRVSHLVEEHILVKVAPEYLGYHCGEEEAAREEEEAQQQLQGERICPCQASITISVAEPVEAVLPCCLSDG